MRLGKNLRTNSSFYLSLCIHYINSPIRQLEDMYASRIYIVPLIFYFAKKQSALFRISGMVRSLRNCKNLLEDFPEEYIGLTLEGGAPNQKVKQVTHKIEIENISFIKLRTRLYKLFMTSFFFSWIRSMTNKHI